jgi:hypothetical protein
MSQSADPLAAKNLMEIDFLKREIELKNIEIDLRTQELLLKNREIQAAKKPPGIRLDPVVVGVIAALFGFLSNLVSTSAQTASALNLETIKLRSNIVLETAKTDDLENAKGNLEFFLASGLLSDPTGSIQNAIRAGKTIVLPPQPGAPSSNEPLQAACTGSNSALQIQIVGHQSDLVEVWDGNTRIIEDFNVARNDTPRGTRLTCDRVRVAGDLALVAMGVSQEILRVYRVIRDDKNLATAVSVLRFAPRELSLSIPAPQDFAPQFQIQGGSGKRFVICADWGGNPQEWGIADLTEGAPVACSTQRQNSDSRVKVWSSPTLPFAVN